MFAMRHGSLVSCTRCGQSNRVPWSRFGDRGRCGSCQADLRPPSHPIEVDGDELAELVRSSPVPVVVDFWAPWCGPCRTLAPELERAAAQADGRFVVAKLDTERNPETAARYGVRALPTLAVFAGGSELARDGGARPAAAVVAFVEKALASRHKRMAMIRTPPSH